MPIYLESKFEIKYNVFCRRQFSIHTRLSVDSSNPFEEDSNDEIIEAYGNTEESINKYFEEKRNAVNSSHRQDSNTAAASETKASELED